MDKKLILKIQSILKSLIEGGDNNQCSMMWELNKCVDNFLREIPTNESLKTVLQKLNVDVIINQTPDAVTLESDFYLFSKEKKYTATTLVYFLVIIIILIIVLKKM